MAGFTEAAPVTNEVMELKNKFKSHFEKSLNKSFQTFVPKTFQMKVENSIIT